jgi:hypothetical protein
MQQSRGFDFGVSLDKGAHRRPENRFDGIAIAAELRRADAHRYLAEPMKAALKRSSCNCGSQALGNAACGLECRRGK